MFCASVAVVVVEVTYVTPEEGTLDFNMASVKVVEFAAETDVLVALVTAFKLDFVYRFKVDLFSVDAKDSFDEFDAIATFEDVSEYIFR